MSQITKDHNDNIQVRNVEGLTIGDLHSLLSKFLAEKPETGHMPVSLCLSEVDTFTTRIVEANFEGDDSTFWLHMDDDISREIVNGGIAPDERI